MRNVKTIFFDAGGTLFRPYPSVGHVYARTAAKHGVNVDPKRVEKLFHAKWHERNGIKALVEQSSEKIERDWWYGLVKDIFSSSPSPFKDFDAFFHELYDLFARAECWRLFDDSIPTLEALKAKGYRLAIISNWDHRLYSIVEQLGLEGYFEHVTASSAVGNSKPGKRIFDFALEAMNAASHESLHVGDSFTDDYHGARSAGLHAVLLDRALPLPATGRPVPRHLRGRPGKGYNATVRIRSLKELPGLLA